MGQSFLSLQQQQQRVLQEISASVAALAAAANRQASATEQLASAVERQSEILRELKELHSVRISKFLLLAVFLICLCHTHTCGMRAVTLQYVMNITYLRFTNTAAPSGKHCTEVTIPLSG